MVPDVQQTPMEPRRSIPSHADDFWREWADNKESFTRAVNTYTAEQDKLVQRLTSLNEPGMTNELSTFGKLFLWNGTPCQPNIEGVLEKGTSESNPNDPKEGKRKTSSVREEGAASVDCAWGDKYKELRKRDVLNERLETVQRNVQGHQRSQPIVQKIMIFMQWWHRLEEPPRRGMVHKITQHRLFNLLVMVVISVNAFYTAYQSNYEMETLGKSPPHDELIETCFVMFFALELVLKIFVHRLHFFCNEDMSWNLLDFFLVMFSLGNVVLNFTGGTMGSLTFARTLRVFKVGKILRIFRAVRCLKELRVMIGSIYGSLSSLWWSFVMIGIILYVFALFFVQQMAVELASSQDNQDHIWKQQRYYFQDVERAVLTLLETTMGGVDWDFIYILLEPLGLMYTMTFIFYICFFNFAVMNILTGIFLEQAMKLWKPDEDEMKQDVLDQKQKTNQEFRRIAEAMDMTGDGWIERSEILAAAESPEFVARMNILGVDFRDTTLFLESMQGVDQDQGIGIEDFIEKVQRLQGASASSALMPHVNSIRSIVEKLDREQNRQMQVLKTMMDQFVAFV